MYVEIYAVKSMLTKVNYNIFRGMSAYVLSNPAYVVENNTHTW